MKNYVVPIAQDFLMAGKKHVNSDLDDEIK
jgi:hypothetical protein